jgi:TonB family protein
MPKILISLIAVVLLCSAGMAQDPQAPKPSETEQPKNAVQQMLDDAKKRGEVIMGTCLVEDCGDAQAADGVEPGRALELVKPVYPPIAAAAHASGEVRVQVIIDTDGTVIAAASISGHPLLQAASVTAARNTRFAPSKYNGEPVKVTGVLVYNFVAP